MAHADTFEEPRDNSVYPEVISTDSVRYEDEFYVGNYEQVNIKAEDGSVLRTLDIEVAR